MIGWWARRLGQRTDPGPQQHRQHVVARPVLVLEFVVELRGVTFLVVVRAGVESPFDLPPKLGRLQQLLDDRHTGTQAVLLDGGDNLVQGVGWKEHDVGRRVTVEVVDVDDESVRSPGPLEGADEDGRAARRVGEPSTWADLHGLTQLAGPTWRWHARVHQTLGGGRGDGAFPDGVDREQYRERFRRSDFGDGRQ